MRLADKDLGGLAMLPISQVTLREFLRLAGDRLDGDWVIVGGSVLPLLGVEHRVTLDIDLASRDGNSSQRTMIALMDIARELGLPVEAINQAAAYFLEKIPHWQDQLVLVYSGEQANFFRPQLSLFLRLKMARLSESDLSDCLEMIRLAAHQEASRDSCDDLLNAIKLQAGSQTDHGKRERYVTLADALKKAMRKVKPS